MAAVAMLAISCSSSGNKGQAGTGTSTSATTAAVQTGGKVTTELDENIPGWNVNTSADNEYVLQMVMNAVWPQVYFINSQLTPVLNTDLVTSATQTSTNPQTIVYQVNPKAVWSDGTPINADDFIYLYQALSGNSKYTDVGGKPYDAASTSGYNQIKSVVGSNPPNGAACDPGSAADRNAGLCPNGDTVTVTFSTPFADWQSLFGDMVPAHIARTKGWNTGFNDFHNAISGSWFQISSYSPNQSIVLTKNPSYWGTPAKLDTVVFTILGSDTDIAPAMKNGEIQVMTSPQTVDTALVQAISAIPGVTASANAGLEFDHLDFNEANPFLAQLPVRQAIAYGTDRSAIIARTVGEIDSTIKPLGNRMFVPGQPQYQDNGTEYATADPAKAKSLLQGAGFTMGSDGYFQKGGKDLALTISSTTGNPIRAQIEQLFQAQMQAIGIKITITNLPAATLFGTNLPKGEYDIALFAWVNTPFVSGNQSIYCSYTNTNECGQNWIHFANPQVDQLMVSANSAPDAATEAKDYNQADQVLWSQMATLPLFQVPQYTAWSNTVANVIPNTSSVGLTWNIQDWGIKAA